MDTENFRRGQVLFWAVVTEGGLGVIAVALGWLLGTPPGEQVSWEPLALVRGLVATLPLLAAFLACVRWPMGPLAAIKQFVDRVVKPLFATCSLADLAVIALLAGIGEELLFRAVVQPYLVERLGPWPGILLASLIFGLAHLITPTYALLAAVVGIYLGCLAYISGNVLDAIVVHGLYDFAALVYLVRIEGRR
jgi:membrane protease YdiL (CAAX protease family)